MKRANILALVIFLLLVGGVFLISPRTTQRLQGGLLQMLSPFLRTGSSAQLKVRSFTEGLKTLRELEKDVKLLRLENEELKATNLMLRDLRDENNRLRIALQYRERSFFDLLAARVIARDSATWWSKVKIDRGSEDGIGPEMPVLTDQGLVGKTTVVGLNISTVLLIGDETCRVAAKVEGTREQGVLSGTRTSTTHMPELTLNFLSKKADLRPGQRVYSSGVGGVFPSGVLLGTVKTFEARELDGRADVAPAVDLTTLQDVFVVIGRK